MNYVSTCLFHAVCSCFPHVINLAVQAIYAALKNGKGLEEQYLLENVAHFGEAFIESTDLPEGVTKTYYVNAFKSDVLGLVRKITTACHVSGKRREELENTVHEGN